MRTILFLIQMRTFRGSYLKLWDYFNHVLTAPGFTARVAFNSHTIQDESNPWRDVPEYVVDDWRALPVDAFLLSGEQWDVAEFHPDWGLQTPVINSVQQVKHAHAHDPRFQHLGKPAIRICVSDEVKDAIVATGLVREPLIVIPNGIDLADVAPAADVEQDVDVLIASLKRPHLGQAVSERLQRPGRNVRLLTEFLPRPAYLRQLQRAKITTFLPNDDEGFYLPALEGMAAGTLVVCPDCVGNRSFCVPGETAFRPDLTVDAIVAATEAALALPSVEAAALRQNALAMASRYTLARERAAFHAVLADLDGLWRTAVLNAPATVVADYEEGRQRKLDATLRGRKRERERRPGGRAASALEPSSPTASAGDGSPNQGAAGGAAAVGRSAESVVAGPPVAALERARVGRAPRMTKREVRAQRLKLGKSHYAQGPDFLIIGAQRAGAKALFQLLSKHPDAGKVIRKEIHFFSWHYERGLPWYLAHFPETAESGFVGEASWSYLADPAAAARVREHLPEAKLIALLRNPIDRAYSQYQLNVRNGAEALPFEAVIAREREQAMATDDGAASEDRNSGYLTRGHYAEQLRRWREAFPAEQMLILESGAVFAEPREAVSCVLRYLEVAAWEPRARERRGDPAYPPMPPATRAILADYYRSHNHALYELVGNDFDWQ